MLDASRPSAEISASSNCINKLSICLGLTIQQDLLGELMPQSDQAGYNDIVQFQPHRLGCHILSPPRNSRSLTHVHPPCTYSLHKLKCSRISSPNPPMSTLRIPTSRPLSSHSNSSQSHHRCLLPRSWPASLAEMSERPPDLHSMNAYHPCVKS